MSRQRNPWLWLGLNAFNLGAEASIVIGARLMKIAAGGAAGESEARRMVNEKIEAGLELQSLAMSGALGFTAPTVAARTLTHYRRKVRANRRRLAKGTAAV